VIRFALHHRDYDQVQRTHEDFNARDRKRRLMGTQIERVTTRYTVDEEGGSPIGYGVLSSGRAVHEAGVYFEYRIHATRDGHTYGPTQPWRAFPSEAEREAAIAKVMDASRRRANKAVGR
jgi:hypothetical protein